MASITVDIRANDEAQRGFNLLRQRIKDTQQDIDIFNRTRTQQERDHTTFLTTQYRRRVQERKRALEEEQRAAERARREEAQAAVRAQREEERLRRYHQQLVIRSRREEARAAEQSARRQQQAIRSVARTYDRVFSSIARIGTRLAGATIFGSILATGSVLRTGIQFDNIRRGLEAVTGSASEATRQVEELRRLAQLPGIQFQQAANATLQLQGTGVAAQRATQLIQVFGNELAIVGGTDLEGVIRALTQIASRGQVAQEEINQLAERLPTINQLLRDAFGVTTAEDIRGVIGNDIEQFFSRLVAAGRSRPQADPNSITNVISNFRNAVSELSDELAQLALPRLTDQIQRATNLIQDNAGRIVQAFERISDIALNVVDDIISGIDTLVNRFESFIGIVRGGLLAGVTLGFTRFFGNATLALTSFTTGLTEATSGSAALATRLGGTRALAGLTRFSTGLRAVTAGLTGLTAALGVGAAIFAGVELFRFLSRDTDVLKTNVERLNDRLTETRDRLESITEVQQTVSQLNRDQVGQQLTAVQQQISSATDDIATQLGLFSDTQARIEIEGIRNQGLSGRTGLERRRRIAGIERETRSQEDLLSLAQERLSLLREEQRTSTASGHIGASQRRNRNAEIELLNGLIERLQTAIRLRRDLQVQFNLARGGTGGASAGATTPATTASPTLPSIDIRAPVDLDVLRVGLQNFREDIRSTSDEINRGINQPFISVLSALDAVVDPGLIRLQAGVQEIEPIQLVDEDAEQDAIRNVFEGIREQTRNYSTELERLLAPGVGRGREVEAGGLISGDIATALDPLTGLRDRLRERYDQIVEDRQRFQDRIQSVSTGFAQAITGAGLDILSIPSQLLEIRRNTAAERAELERGLAADIERIRNNAELNERQRTRRITNVQARAAEARVEIARQAANARSEAYRGWARTAIQSIAQVIAAEAQAAIGRSIVQSVTPLVGTALAGIGTGGTLGLGIGAIAGLQLLASSFHNPILDEAARHAGLRQAQQLQSSPVQYGEQSGRDLVNNYNSGFQQGLQSGQGGAGGGQPIVIQLEHTTNLDGRELAKEVTRQQIMLDAQNILPERT